MQRGLPRRNDERNRNPYVNIGTRNKIYHDSRTPYPMPNKEHSNGNKLAVHSSQILRKPSSSTESTLASTDCSASTLTSSGSPLTTIYVDSDECKDHSNKRISKRVNALADVSNSYCMSPASTRGFEDDESLCATKFSTEKQLPGLHSVRRMHLGRGLLHKVPVWMISLSN